jgi:hypothetical protein
MELDDLRRARLDAREVRHADDSGVGHAVVLEGVFQPAVVVGGVDERKAAPRQQRMHARLADVDVAAVPGAVHPAAQRPDAAVHDAEVLGQREVAALGAKVLGRHAELLRHVLDQRAPGRQPQPGRHPGADEQQHLRAAVRFAQLLQLFADGKVRAANGHGRIRSG